MVGKTRGRDVGKLVRLRAMETPQKRRRRQQTQAVPNAPVPAAAPEAVVAEPVPGSAAAEPAPPPGTAVEPGVIAVEGTARWLGIGLAVGLIVLLGVCALAVLIAANRAPVT